MKSLQSRLIELERENCMLSDEEQWFTEIEEIWERKVGYRKKAKCSVLVGRIHWKEDFIDEDTGDVITVSRNRLVRMDGEWV